MSAPRGPWQRLAFGVLRWRAAVVCCWLLLLGLASLAAPSVRFTGDVAALLPPDHPHLRLAQLLDERARPARVLWLLLEGDDAAAVSEVAATLRESPYLLEVAATREQLSAAAMNSDGGLFQLDDQALQALAQRLSPAGRAEAIAELLEQLADDPIGGRELAVRDPLGLRFVFAAADPAHRFGLDPQSPYAVLADGSAALLRLVGCKDASDADFATALMADLEARLRGRNHSCYGGYAIARAESQRMREDLEGSSAWSLGLALGFLAWSMRSLLLPLLVLLPATAALLLALPFASVLFGPLPAIAVAAAAVLIGLGDDFAIHYLAQYRSLRRTQDHGGSVAGAHHRIGPELVIDAMVTSGAFLVLGTSELRGLLGFGLLLALGLALCLLAVLTALPLGLARLGARALHERSRLAECADRCAADRRGMRIALFAFGLAAASGVLLWCRGVPLTADPLALRPAGDPQQQLRLRLEQQLGFDPLPLLLLWRDGASLEQLDRVLGELRAAGRIATANGLSRQEVPSVRQRVLALREQIAAACDALPAELERAGFRAAPFAAGLHEWRARLLADAPPPAPVLVSLGQNRYRVVQVHATTATGGGFDAFAEAAGALGGEALMVYGAPLLERDLERVLRGDLGRTSLLALLLTMVLVSAFTRSLRSGLLAMLPSLIGVSVTLAVLSLAGQPLTLASFVAVPLLLGIGVDEGVHVVCHLRGGARPLGATGVAVVRSTATTALAFAALATVQSPGLAGLGRTVALGMTICLLASLFVLPPLLRRWPAAGGVRP